MSAWPASCALRIFRFHGQNCCASWPHSSPILWRHGIAQMLFSGSRAAWAATAPSSALFTLPVAGTAINIADQHLHPRNIATAPPILLAIQRVLGAQTDAGGCIAGGRGLGLSPHGRPSCFVLPFPRLGADRRGRLDTLRTCNYGVLKAFPLAWVFDQPTQTGAAPWKRGRTTSFPARTWYEWLGAPAPRYLRSVMDLNKQAKPRAPIGERPIYVGDFQPGRTPVRKHSLIRARVLALLLYGVFQQLVAQVVLGTPALVALSPCSPCAISSPRIHIPPL